MKKAPKYADQAQIIDAMCAIVPVEELAKHSGIKLETLRKYWKGYQPAGERTMGFLVDAKEKWLKRNPVGTDRVIVLRETERLKTRLVPVVSYSHAGLSGNYEDLANQFEEWVETDLQDPSAYALVVEGDSMYPDYKQGDRIVVDPHSEARNGDVVVARLKRGDALLKIFQEDAETKVTLSSYNPAYPPQFYERKDFQFIHAVYEMKRYARRRN